MNGDAARTAGSFIDALKGQPLSLALVAMNLGLLGFLYYTGVIAHDERLTEMKMLYENRSEMARLLASCVPLSQYPFPTQPQK